MTLRNEKNTDSLLSVLYAFLLSITLSSAVFSVYSVSFFSVWTLLLIVVTVLVFLLCEFVNRHHIIGGAAFTILTIADMLLFFRLVFANDWGSGFQTWFFSGAELADTKMTYLLAILVSFVPFFGTVVFYFTRVLYRMVFLTVISLIPCALYVKVLSEIDNVYISIIAILNVILLIDNIRSVSTKGRNNRGSNVFRLSSAVLIFLVLVVSAAIPKESEARYYDRFEELFLGTGVQITIDERYSIFSEFSGNADYFSGFKNRRMYTLYGEDVPYFKKQSFDYYDFDNDRWYADDAYSVSVYTGEQWYDNASLLSTAELRSAIIAAEEYESGFVDRYSLNRLVDYSDYTDELKTVRVSPEGFGAVYYLSPARAISVNITNSDDVYVTEHGVFRTAEKPHNKNQDYSVSYYDEFTSRIQWCELGGADFDDEKNMQMLSELYRILSDNGNELAENVQAFIEMNQNAMSYRELCEENNEKISDEIRQLAAEITSGLTYDWEKAYALQSYFFEEDFVYDLKYTAEDTSPEYFLFESKKGTCSDFASAYVLLARVSGLTVRYAEGFNPDISSRENVFIIKDSCAHAYPEVYINNLGWTVFEPTVASGYNTAYADDTDNGAAYVDYSLIFVLCVIFSIVLCLALAGIFIYPIAQERLFMRSVIRRDNDECVIRLYQRLMNVRCKKIIKGNVFYTPFELGVELEKTAGCDISTLVYSVEKISYGEQKMSDAQRNECVECYNEAKLAITEYIKNTNREKRRRRKGK